MSGLRTAITRTSYSALGVVLTLLMLALGGPAEGADYYVTTTADNCAAPILGSLRWAINQANAGGPDDIRFDGLTGTFNMSGGVATAGNTRLGYLANGIANFSGNATYNAGGNMIVGWNAPGTGLVTVTENATINTGWTVIAGADGTAGNVNVSGNGTILGSGQLFVGDTGLGGLDISC